MRRPTITNHKLSFNAFLLSVFLNLALLLGLSFFEEHVDRSAEDALAVSFVSLSKTRPQRRSVELPPKQPSASIPREAELSAPRVKSFIFTGEIAAPQSGPATPVNIDSSASQDPSRPASVITARRQSISPLSSPAGALQRGNVVPSGVTGREAGGQIGAVGRGIVPRQPLANIAGTGNELSGYYNISLVRYEDTSDNISTNALKQLANAMNRWTKIKTKVIGEPIMLDDPKLLQVPMIYITSRRSFAFSERERENLRKYLAGGGFLLFSNTASSEAEAQGVANSIEFELWKAGATSDLSDLGKKHKLYESFFDLSDSMKLLGIASEGRSDVIYEDSGYGITWAAPEGKDSEKYLKLGVNIIAYALTTSPLVVSYQ